MYLVANIPQKIHSAKAYGLKSYVILKKPSLVLNSNEEERYQAVDQ